MIPTLPSPPSLGFVSADSKLRAARAAVVEAYRPRVRALVRRMAPAEHRSEGEQVGLIGVCVALERFDAARAQDGFWPFAMRFARGELEMWLGRGVYWRGPTGRLFGDAEVRGRLAAFLKTLTPADRALLLCAKRERAEGARARRYSSLVARAKAFVEGAA